MTTSTRTVSGDPRESRWLDDSTLKRAVDEVVRRLADKTVRDLSHLPWTARIVPSSVEPDTVFVGAGRKAGVSSGQLFVVYRKNDIESEADSRSWDPIGMIRITDIDAMSASAEAIHGDGFEAGDRIGPITGNFAQR